MRLGQVEWRTHDYMRHGTTSLFAALDMKAGTVVGKRMSRHRATEFHKFLDEVECDVPTGLDIHVVMDNYGTYKTNLIRNWFAAQVAGALRRDILTEKAMQPRGRNRPGGL